MNYSSIKGHLEMAHSILLRTGDEIDHYDLGFFPATIKAKDWSGALSCLEEVGASSQCGAEYWAKLLEAAKELQLPRYVARIEKRLQLEGG